MARKRIIYQSEALYVGSTGVSQPTQLHRVQDVSHSIELNRTDVNEFGKLAALSREIIEAPTVSLDFSYYSMDGHNESGIGLTVQGRGVDTPTSALSGMLAGTSDEKNYYILTVPEGEDAVAGSYTDRSKHGVIGIGNGFVTSYTFDAAVGEIPSASVSVEGANINYNTGSSSIANPAVFPGNGDAVSNPITIPEASTGSLSNFVLRPGDISVNFGTTGLQQGGALLPGMENDLQGQSLNLSGFACVQSVSIDFPLARTPLQCLGNVYPTSREIDLPASVSINVSANLADITSGTLRDILCDTAEERTIQIQLNNRCAQNDTANMIYTVKGCTLDSQSFSSSIGDNKTVDLVFNAQLGGSNDSARGVFISGTA